MFEYVPKTEYAPVREEIEEIIRKAQSFLRKNYGITFQYHLIGSGNRHLIMRDTSGNKGYDFDYYEKNYKYSFGTLYAFLVKYSSFCSRKRYNR